MKKTKELGEFGEKIALDFLKKKGYKILEKNWKRKWAEIDLVCKKGNKFIFVEVRTLKDQDFHPQESLTPFKIKSLLRSVKLYLFEKKLFEVLWQIDFLFVEIKKDKMKIWHFENQIEDESC